MSTTKAQDEKEKVRHDACLPCPCFQPALVGQRCLQSWRLPHCDRSLHRCLPCRSIQSNLSSEPICRIPQTWQVRACDHLLVCPLKCVHVVARNEDAEKDCDAVIPLDKKNVKGYFWRGQARVVLQKLKGAESGALCKRPRTPTPLLMAEAIRTVDFQEALKLDPSNGSVKQELGKVRDALKSFPIEPKNVRTTRRFVGFLPHLFCEEETRRYFHTSSCSCNSPQAPTDPNHYH